MLPCQGPARIGSPPPASCSSSASTARIPGGTAIRARRTAAFARGGGAVRPRR